MTICLVKKDLIKGLQSSVKLHPLWVNPIGKRNHLVYKHNLDTSQKCIEAGKNIIVLDVNKKTEALSMSTASLPKYRLKMPRQSHF